MKIILSLFTILALSGCTAPVQHNTPSGKAEITVTGNKKEQIKSKITNVMIDKHYTVSKSDSMVLAFDRPVQDPTMQMLLGSDYNSTPNSRVTFTFIQNKNSTRVIADFAVITNPGSAFEKPHNMNGHRNTMDFQNILDDIKNQVQK